MKKLRIGFVFMSMLLMLTLAANLVGCSVKMSAKDLMEGITPNEVIALENLSGQNAAVTDFSVRLFQASEESGKNTLISPLSVLCALAMTANGAEKETLAQMETVLGMSTEALNLYLYSYMNALPVGEKYKLSLANSIWFIDDERFTVNPDFLQTNADYYSSGIYKAPFDESTRRDINNWVKAHTDGMIPEVLDKISHDAVMYLVNALAFEAEWEDVYKKNQVRDGVFTKADGTKRDVEMMHGSENIYLEDEKAVGFMKFYNGRKYAFVALLPKEGIRISEYIDALDGESLNALLSNPQYTMVHTKLPKFESEYSTDLVGVLSDMGMPEAFNPYLADFGALGTSTAGPIYISRVLHKTFISVGEKGTRAGAATVVEMGDNGAAIVPKEVYLDRPFVYLLVDCENNLPFFIGTMMDPTE